MNVSNEPIAAASPLQSQAAPVRGARVVAAVIFAACVAVLALAAWLEPDPAGLGTHQRLGLPPCGLYTMTGIPCATCGMTTAFSLAVRGRIAESFFTQPAGALLAWMTAVACLISAWATVTGASLAPLAKALWRPSCLLVFGGIVLLAWIYKIIVVVGMQP